MPDSELKLKPESESLLWDLVQGRFRDEPQL